MKNKMQKIKHVSVRLTEDQIELIKRAAAERPKQSVNNFILEAALIAAETKTKWTEK